MKVLAEKQSNFKPVKLEIVFETQLELDTFGSLFNCTPVCEVIRPMLDPVPLRNAIEDLGGDSGNYPGQISTALGAYYRNRQML